MHLWALGRQFGCQKSSSNYVKGSSRPQSEFRRVRGSVLDTYLQPTNCCIYYRAKAYMYWSCSLKPDIAIIIERFRTVQYSTQHQTQSVNIPPTAKNFT